jgi:hypothetical protein
LKHKKAPTKPATTTTTESIDFGEELCCFEMKIESVGADDFGQGGEYNLKKQAVEGQIVFYKRGSGNYLSFERSSRSWTLFVRNHGLFHSEPGETNCPKGMPMKKNGVKVAQGAFLIKTGVSFFSSMRIIRPACFANAA